MQSGVCIGGLTRDGVNVRLIPRGRQNHPENAAYEIGDIWEMELTPVPQADAPHVEDHTIDRATRIGRARSLATLIPSRAAVWRGGPDSVFGGALRYRTSGRAYIAREAIPACSVGFWIPDRPLESRSLSGKPGYVYQWQDGRNATFRYVGFEPPIPIIRSGSLIRVSLARWWRPPDDPSVEESCYAQISGWYPG